MLGKYDAHFLYHADLGTFLAAYILPSVGMTNNTDYNIERKVPMQVEQHDVIADTSLPAPT